MYNNIIHTEVYMADIKSNESTAHELRLTDRRTLNMNGVNEVISFDDSSVVLKTVCGELVIEGTELHISALDTARGAVAVDGNIQSIVYYDVKTGERRSRFGKLIK